MSQDGNAPRNWRHSWVGPIVVGVLAIGVIALVARRSGGGTAGDGLAPAPTRSTAPPAADGAFATPVPTTRHFDITIPPTTTPTTQADDGLNPLGGNDPEDKLMPDVVCMNLQAAQDEIQDHGVFLSKSKDASGEGRRQIWDRNWVVIAQLPAAGEPIGEAEAVLSVLKKDEVTTC